MPKQINSEKFGFLITDDFRKRIEDKAESECRTPSNVVQKMIYEFLSDIKNGNIDIDNELSEVKENIFSLQPKKIFNMRISKQAKNELESLAQKLVGRKKIVDVIIHIIIGAINE